MGSNRLVLLVTGSVASGKTDFLARLHRSTSKQWRTCGFYSPGGERPLRSGTPALTYTISTIGEPGTLPWAERRVDGRGFEFSTATRDQVVASVITRLDHDAPEICFLDEIGQLELDGQGFAELFRRALGPALAGPGAPPPGGCAQAQHQRRAGSRCKIIVAAVKKSRLAAVVAEFQLADAVVLDLDEVSAEAELRTARRRIAAADAERIGAFAGIGGLVEVGLGSTLHAYRVPFKGHFLAYLQNLLLIAFGKSLHGRGLIRIAFISAMLKAFSPVGNSFRPMAYIFFQGLAFAAPIRLAGWHIGSVVTGSIMMAWLTLALSLAVDYVTFGRAIFDAFGGAISSVSGWLGVDGPSISQVIAGAFVLKAVIAAALATTAFFGDMQPLVQRLGARRTRRRTHRPHGTRPAVARQSLSATAVAALRDMARPRFVIAFLISVLLLLFFAGLSRSDAVNLVIRGLCISYLGLVAMRRVDVRSVGAWLDRRAGLGLAESLPLALATLGRAVHHHPEPVAGDVIPEPIPEPAGSGSVSE